MSSAADSGRCLLDRNAILNIFGTFQSSFPLQGIGVRSCLVRAKMGPLIIESDASNEEELDKRTLRNMNEGKRLNADKKFIRR